MAATLALLLEAVSPRDESGTKRLATTAPLVASAVVFFLVGATWNPSRTFYAECLSSAEAGLRHKSLVSDQEVQTYKTLQQSVPPGVAILTRLDRPFLLDFKRNPVFLVDYAEASPPPGMPYSKGGEALARYLIPLPVRYVAYSYSDEAERRSAPAHDVVSPWMRNQLRYTDDFEDDLEELAKTRRRIYDDGNNFVLDLLQSRTGSPSH